MGKHFCRLEGKGDCFKGNAVLGTAEKAIALHQRVDPVFVHKIAMHICQQHCFYSGVQINAAEFRAVVGVQAAAFRIDPAQMAALGQLDLHISPVGLNDKGILGVYIAKASVGHHKVSGICLPLRKRQHFHLQGLGVLPEDTCLRAAVVPAVGIGEPPLGGQGICHGVAAGSECPGAQRPGGDGNGG